MTFISGAVAQSPTIQPTARSIENIVISSANTIQSHTFPTNTRKFLLRARHSGKILLHDSNSVLSPYLTIPCGANYMSPDLEAGTHQIFFQSPIAGLVIEAESWS